MSDCRTCKYCAISHARSVHVHDVHEGMAEVQWFKISIRTSVSHRINPSKVRTFVLALIWGADKWSTCTIVTSLRFSREKMNTNAYTWPSIVALCSPSLVVTCFVPRPQSVWEQDLDCNHVATCDIMTAGKAQLQVRASSPAVRVWSDRQHAIARPFCVSSNWNRLHPCSFERKFGWWPTVTTVLQMFCTSGPQDCNARYSTYMHLL